MEMQAPKGTKDMLPQDAYKWHFVEKVFRDTGNRPDKSIATCV